MKDVGSIYLILFIIPGLMLRWPPTSVGVLTDNICFLDFDPRNVSLFLPY